MNENNILDFQEHSILITYHADKSMKYLLRGFLFFIISFISFCAFLYGIVASSDLNNFKAIALGVLSFVSLLIAALFTISGLYHLVYFFIKKEILPNQRFAWLILLGVLDALALFSCILLAIMG